jgi:hypothetical protein
MIVELSGSKAWSAEADGAPLEVRVLAGAVWLTQEADPADHVLERGASFTSRPHGRVALQPLAPARVEVAPVAHGRYEPAARAA